MKAPKTKLENICEKATRGARSYLTAPYLDVAKARLVATNGHALVIHPVVVDDGDTSGHVPLDALKAVRGKRADSTITLNGNAIAGGVQYPRPDLGQYPYFDRVIPAKPSTPPTVIFDAELLFKLAQAMTDRQAIVRVWVGKYPGDALYIEARHAPEGVVGVLMPCRDIK